MSHYNNHYRGTMTEKLRITLSDRPPVNIEPDDWPVIAEADWHDGEVRRQANSASWIRVRENRDGRRIVYGFAGDGGGGQPGRIQLNAGFVVAASQEDAEDGTKMPDTAETIRAIRRVGGALAGAPYCRTEHLAAKCIADLPAEDL